MNNRSSEYQEPLSPLLLQLRRGDFNGGRRWQSKDTELYYGVNSVLKRARWQHC